MLTYLHVKNFALIQALELELSHGMTVLTGETGAGKSILIGSMDAIAGGKLTKDIIRRGEDYAQVEMQFELSSEVLKPFYEAYDLAYEDENEILLSRRYSNSGRSVYRINDQLVTANVMSNIARQCIDIHSQHEHQSLLKPEQHIKLLDQYIDGDIHDIKLELANKYSAYKSVLAQLDSGELDSGLRAREMDFLRFEIEEIEKARLQEGEDVQLSNEYKILANRKKIVQNLASVDQMVRGEQESSAILMMEEILNAFSSIRNLDAEIEQMAVMAEQAESVIYDLSRELEHYIDRLDMDHTDLKQVEDRLHVINSLKQKFGDTIDEILNTLGEKQQLLNHYENFDRNVLELEALKTSLTEEIIKLCQKLHDKRVAGGRKIAAAIEGVLYELNFDHAKVSIEVERKDKFNALGYDQVTIMIGTNKNEGVKPLHKIASGGELSRVMLAIKSLFADMDQIDTLVFDEIDTGISGRTAQKVAEKMAILAKSRQIICITHLPQISAMAKEHVLIAKEEVDDRVVTTLTKLDDDGINMELARMIGGAEITSTTMKTAAEMKTMAKKLVKSL